MTHLTGICDICNKPARHLNTCWKCGRNVCDQHYDQTTGLCTQCKKGPTIKEGAPWKKK